MRSDYRPELDTSPAWTPEQVNYCMSFIGILRWAVELGRLDIYIDATLLTGRIFIMGLWKLFHLMRQSLEVIQYKWMFSVTQIMQGTK
jgi:hypothetical protein